MDFPSSQFYTELSSHYPEAKVVLTVRDPGEWYECVASTTWRLTHDWAILILAQFQPAMGKLLELSDAVGCARWHSWWSI